MSSIAFVLGRIRRHRFAALRSWFAGGCIGGALTLALLNPLMCLLHCAFMDQYMTDPGLRAQAFNCAMMHHHQMPMINIQAMPDNLPSIGITLDPPRAFYEMSLTIFVISLLLIVIDSTHLPAHNPLKYLGRAPLAPPPKC